jgi:antitoxin MazE
MNTVLQKWGNSLALRIPRTIAAEIAVAEGHAVDLQVSKGRLVIAPVKTKQYELADLIAGMTAKNRHSEISSGSRRGRESW